MHFIWIFKVLEFRSELTIFEAIGLRFVAGVWGFYSAFMWVYGALYGLYTGSGAMFWWQHLGQVVPGSRVLSLRLKLRMQARAATTTLATERAATATASLATDQQQKPTLTSYHHK